MRQILLFIVFIQINTPILGQNLQLYNNINPTSRESYDSSEEKDKTFIQSLPKLISTGSPWRVIPDIKLLATNLRRNNNRGTVHNLELFTTGVNFDTSVVQNGFNFLMPAASKIGLRYQYSALFNSKNSNAQDLEKQSIAVNFSLHFLGKEIPEFNTNDVVKGGGSIFVVHSKLGFEWLFLKNFLSIYGDINAIGTGLGVSTFKDYFSLEQNKVFWFLEYGIRCELAIDDNKMSQLSLQLGFLNHAGEVDKFLDSEDVLTPFVKIGFTRLFEMSPNAKDPSTDPDAPAGN